MIYFMYVRQGGFDMYCYNCGNKLPENSNFCNNCGTKVRRDDESFKETNTSGKEQENFVDKFTNAVYDVFGFERDEPKQQTDNKSSHFSGIYKYDFWGRAMEVYCPRCGSSNCSHYKEQVCIPGKTKTRYTANLNPLKPFTLVNKKEKVIRRDINYTADKILCNDCGKIFQ